jgi:hypothetical protein
MRVLKGKSNSNKEAEEDEDSHRIWRLKAVT